MVDLSRLGLSIGLMIICLHRQAYCNEDERRLYKRMLEGYDVRARPVENNSMPVQVSLLLTLNQIIDVDEKNQIIQTNLWMKYIWEDYYLKWNPADYGGVADIRIPYGQIWVPDVLLYNSVDQQFDTTLHVNHVLYSNGTINWLPPGIVKSSCNIDIRWFPFDEQTCNFTFSSWTYHSGKLNLSILDIGWDNTTYIINGEWDVPHLRVYREEFIFDCCPEPYSVLNFQMVIRRRTLYYGFNMIIPSLIVSLMTLLGFALPVESGEKVTLEITVLLSICVFLGMVASMTPATSEALPLIGIFFSCNMILVALSVVCSVVVLNFHYRTPDTHTMSPRLRNIMLNWLPWLLMMRRPGHKFSRKSIVEALKKPPPKFRGEFHDNNHLVTPTYVGFSHDKSMSNGMNDEGLGRIRRMHSTDLESRLLLTLHNATNNSNLDQGTLGLLLTMQQVYSEVKFMAKRMEREDEVQDAKNDWRFAAMVVDRLCLVCFSALIILSTCGIFFSAPYIL